MFLIASKTRSSFPSFATHLAVTTYAMSFPFLPHAVPQDADALDLELDHVSGPQPAVQLQARAARCGSGSEHVTRVERLGHRRVGDQVAEAVVHVRRRVLAPGLAVDAGCHPEVVCCELVGCDDACPSTFEPSQSFAFAGPIPIGSSRACTSRADTSFQIVHPNTCRSASAAAMSRPGVPTIA